MKKLIAILTIAIVLVGSVFAGAGETGTPAEQSGRITIRSEVVREDPTFVLKGGVSANSLTAVGNDGAEGSGAELKQATMSDWDISQANITAFFGIFQTSKAKNQFTYTFSVAPTQFVQYETSTGAAPTNAYTVNKAVDIHDVVTQEWFDDDTEGVESATAPSVTEATGTDLIDTLGGSITFDGTKVVNPNATASAPATVSTFQITWTYDREAPAGKYQADILLTVTAS